jgi:hypothetical protein
LPTATFSTAPAALSTRAIFSTGAVQHRALRRCMFQVLQMFQRYVTSISYGCCIDCTRMLKISVRNVSSIFQTYFASKDENGRKTPQLFSTFTFE